MFCAGKEHMDEMVSHVLEWFAGVNPDVVYEAYSNDPNTDKAFADYKTDTSDRLKLAQEPKRKSENLNVSADHKTGEGIGWCSRSFDPE